MATKSDLTTMTTTAQRQPVRVAFESSCGRFTGEVSLRPSDGRAEVEWRDAAGVWVPIYGDERDPMRRSIPLLCCVHVVEPCILIHIFTRNIRGVHFNLNVLQRDTNAHFVGVSMGTTWESPDNQQPDAPVACISGLLCPAATPPAPVTA